MLQSGKVVQKRRFLNAIQACVRQARTVRATHAGLFALRPSLFVIGKSGS